MTLGNRQGSPNGNDSKSGFNRPTNFWPLANGNMLISDGYGNSRIVELERLGVSRIAHAHGGRIVAFMIALTRNAVPKSELPELGRQRRVTDEEGIFPVQHHAFHLALTHIVIDGRRAVHAEHVQLGRAGFWRPSLAETSAV